MMKRKMQRNERRYGRFDLLVLSEMKSHDFNDVLDSFAKLPGIICLRQIGPLCLQPLFRVRSCG